MNNNIYNKLSKLSFLSKNYTAKFLFVAFLGIHVPLITIVAFISTNVSDLSATNIIIITLIATLVATGLTLIILNGLLWPLHIAKKALTNYLENNQLPNLPTQYKDEAGTLLLNLQYVINKLDNMMAEKKDLIALFSHDMRSPTAHMIGLSKLISKEANETKRVEYCNMLHQIAQKQSAFLDGILQMLKIDNSLAEEKFVDVFSIQSTINESIEQYQISASNKSIAIQSTFTDKPILLKGNQSLFTEVINNLLANAIKFSNENGVIEIGVNLNKEGNCTITIKDYGIGFEPDLNEKIFDKFTRFGKKGTHGESSTGLGLYLVRKILLKHQGNITALSQGNGQGTVFTIEVPQYFVR